MGRGLPLESPAAACLGLNTLHMDATLPRTPRNEFLRFPIYRQILVFQRLPLDLPSQRPTLVSFESAAGTEINALSTSQLATVLNEAHRRFRLAPVTLIGSLGLFIISSISGDQMLVGLSALFATVLIPISIFLDRYRRSVKVGIKLDRIAQTITTVPFGNHFPISKIAMRFGTCRPRDAPLIGSDMQEPPRLVSGADFIRPQFARPGCIRGNVRFPEIKLGSAELFFLPDAVLVVSKRTVAAPHYRDLYFSEGSTRFIEEGRVPSDTAIVGHT